MQQANRNDPFFIKALNVVALLKAVLDQANEISLQAMNAKSVVARAGEKVRAIQPITDHMDKLAKNIIGLVGQISSNSLEISRASLTEFMEDMTVSHFKNALKLGQDSKYIRSLDGASEAATASLDATRNKIGVNVQTLSGLLEEIDVSLLAASAVTSKFRLEIGTSETEYEESFESLVEKLEFAIGDIRKNIHDSKKTLIVSVKDAAS